MSRSTTDPVQRSIQDGGPYLLIIDGLPPNSSWQALKDIARAVGVHGIWTEVLSRNGGSSGSVRVSRKDPATKLYAALTLRNLVVHLWNTTRPEALPVFMRSNCNELCQRTGHANRVQTSTTPRQSMPVSTSASRQTASYPDMRQLANPPQMIALQQALQIQRSRAMVQQEQAEAARVGPSQIRATHLLRSVYPPGAPGTPVNTSQGFVRTESRGIFIQNLPYSVKAEELERRFGKIGEIEECDIARGRDGNSRGIAAIRFVSAADAQEAIKLCNGQEFCGKRIRVRDDKQRQTVGTVYSSSASAARSNDPIIANGSGL